jgi:hypothetical protein
MLFSGRKAAREIKERLSPLESFPRREMAVAQ